jgi:thiol-disulfide isomerase/thioredoxin
MWRLGLWSLRLQRESRSPGVGSRGKRQTTRFERSRLAAIILLVATGSATQVASDDAASGLPVGAEMEDFGLRRLDFATGKLGATVWLSDFVGEGAKQPRKRLLLLSFFAAWCQPCLRELPVLAELQQRHGAAGLQVLSVYERREGESFVDAVAQTRKQLQSHVPPFPLLFDRYTTRNQRLYLGTRAVLPCNVLIDGAGRIVGRFQGGRSAFDGTMAAAVERLLAGPERP